MKCPYCEAEISNSAAKCRHCGEWIRNPPAQPQTPPPQPIYVPTPVPVPVPQRQVVVQGRKSESVAFAVITLLAYIFVYPIGLLLNLVGVFTGPRRGCFVSMFIVCFGIWAVIFLIALAADPALVNDVIEEIRRSIR